MRRTVRTLAVPLIAMAIFLFAWSRLSAGIQTRLGRIPGPLAVVEQAEALWAEHLAEREKARVFYERQTARNDARPAEGEPNGTVASRTYTGKPTFIDELIMSLGTVFAGFVLATLIAVPIGVLCGLSTTVNRALSPFIHAFLNRSTPRG